MQLKHAFICCHTIGYSFVNEDWMCNLPGSVLMTIHPQYHRKTPVIHDNSLDASAGSGELKCTGNHLTGNWQMNKKSNTNNYKIKKT